MQSSGLHIYKNKIIYSTENMFAIAFAPRYVTTFYTVNDNNTLQKLLTIDDDVRDKVSSIIRELQSDSHSDCESDSQSDLHSSLISELQKIEFANKIN
jgi:hypothetical protein